MEHFMVFDHVPAGTPSLALGTGAMTSFDVASGFTTTVSVSGRIYLAASSGGGWSKAVPGGTTLTVGFRVNHLAAGSGTDSGTFFQLFNASSQEILNLLYTNSTGLISVRRGSTVLGISTTALSQGSEHFVELAVTAHSSTGSFELAINGDVEASDPSVNTAGAAGDITRFRVLGVRQSNVSTLCFTDFYFRDDMTLRGPILMRALRGTADATAEWTRDSGASNVSRINETTTDQDTSYVETDTEDDQDIYDMGDLPANPGPIIALVPVMVARASAGGAPEVALSVISNSDESTPEGFTLSGSYRSYISAPIYDDPDTSTDWTESGVNAVQLALTAVG